jgi:hypothetical protein
MRFEDDLIAMSAGKDFMMCCRVAHCEDRVLIAVFSRTDAVTVLDALTSDVICQFRTKEKDLIVSVAAFQREDGTGVFWLSRGGGVS